MSSVTEEIDCKVAVATDRIMLEFTSFCGRYYDALEFAHKALTELGIILSIYEADRKLTESGRNMIGGIHALIPLAPSDRPTVQAEKDAKKNLDVAWGVLSRKLCCAHKFSLYMIHNGVYDLTFLRAFNLIHLSSEDKEKALVKYIRFKADDREADEQAMPARQNMENGKHPAKGDSAEFFPKKPSTDDFQMYGFVSCMMTPYMDKDPAIREPYKKYPLVILMPGVAELTREFGWQLMAPHRYGEEIMNCFSMLRNLEERSIEGRKKTWFWSSTLSPSLSENVPTIKECWAGNWNDMDTIAVPLSFRLHYFLMVISFKYQKVYILDSHSSRVYFHGELDVHLKRMHDCMNASFSEYRGSHDITKWDVVCHGLHLSTQIDLMNSGAHVCFFMERLEDLIPTPKCFLVNDHYLRIWVALKISRSHHNKFKQHLLESFEKFKKSPESGNELPMIH